MTTQTATLVFTVPASVTGKTKGRSIWVGSSSWAGAPALKPAGVLNVSYDWTDCYAFPGMSNCDKPKFVAPPKPADEKSFQLAKLGLIDGDGNDDMTLVSAVYMADQLFNFPPGTPDPALSNDPMDSGDLLIHCWSGHSRSVTIAALYIYYCYGLFFEVGTQLDPNGQSVDYSNFDEVLTSVETSRQSPSGTPTPGMQAAAARITAGFSALFPVPASTDAVNKLQGARRG